MPVDMAWGLLLVDDVDSIALLQVERWEVFDDLARSLRVKRLFHGHTHDDNSAAFKLERNRMGFEVVTVNSRSIKNGLGEIVYEYAPERAWQMEQNRDWAAP